jgi:hypothetical protein
MTDRSSLPFLLSLVLEFKVEEDQHDSTPEYALGFHPVIMRVEDLGPEYLDCYQPIEEDAEVKYSGPICSMDYTIRLTVRQDDAHIELLGDIITVDELFAMRAAKTLKTCLLPLCLDVVEAYALRQSILEFRRIF